MTKRNKLLLTVLFCFALNACNGCDKYKQEMIVVNKIPMGAWAEDNDPDEFRGIGWYNIGLSRNGKEPVEYIWHAEDYEYDHAIMNAEIGDKGTINLQEWAIEQKRELPCPNAKNPHTIGVIGEAEWKKER
jgi:hypothetical protein